MSDEQPTEEESLKAAVAVQDAATPDEVLKPSGGIVSEVCAAVFDLIKSPD